MKKFFFSAALSLFTLMLAADFTEDFQNAQKQFERRNWNEAAVFFEKAAQNAPVGIKDKCYSYAARALAQQRKRKEAEETAGKIQNASWKNYTQMEILSTFGKFNEIAERFQTEKIDTWPEEIAYLGFFLRGRGMGWNPALSKDAVADLEKSLAQCGSDDLTRILVLNTLIRAFRNTGDNAKALAAADKALAMKKFKGFYAYLDSAMQKNQILISEKKFEEARKTLDTLNSERKWNGGAWYLVYLENCGDLALAQGKTADAKKFYGQAIAVENVHPGLTGNVKNKWNKIK